MAKIPAFQFYTGDWLKDTGVLSVAAAGAWIRLLVAMWDAEPRGELTLDLDSYSRVLGCSEALAETLIRELTTKKVCNTQTDSNGFLTVICRRMVNEEKERVSSRLRYKKWNDKRQTNADKREIVSHSSKSSTTTTPTKPSNSKPATVTDRPETGGFDLFWRMYPRKEAKQAALKAWEKLKPDTELRVTIGLALEKQCQAEQWTKDNGQFIPHPATWLNQERWKDEASNNGNTQGHQAGKRRSAQTTRTIGDSAADFADDIERARSRGGIVSTDE